MGNGSIDFIKQASDTPRLFKHIWELFIIFLHDRKKVTVVLWYGDVLFRLKTKWFVCDNFSSSWQILLNFV